MASSDVVSSTVVLGQFLPVLHDGCNKGRGLFSCLWDDAYKRTLAANPKDLLRTESLAMPEAVPASGRV